MVMAAPVKAHQSELLKLLLASGFCGGFTTFSALSNEGFQMIRHQLYLLFAAYAVSSVVLGLAAVALGYYIIRSL
jgi:CrcB protein